VIRYAKGKEELEKVEVRLGMDGYHFGVGVRDLEEMKKVVKSYHDGGWQTVEVLFDYNGKRYYQIWRK